MTAVVGALLPVFTLIVLGQAFKRWGGFTPEFWRGLARITYYVFLPALFIGSLSRAELTWDMVTGVGLALVLASGAVGVAVLLARRPLIAWRGGPTFTSVFQGAVRWNSFVALAVAERLLGAPGVTLIALALVTLVAPLNVASVVVLARDGEKDGERHAVTARSLAHDVATNPLIVGCLIGLLASLAPALPTVVATTLDMLSAPALACGLLLAGAGLQLDGLKRLGPMIALAAGIKLVLLPAAALLVCRLMGLDGLETSAVLITASVPTAAASFILAAEMGGDAPLMARIVTIQTGLAFLTMPVWLALAG